MAYEQCCCLEKMPYLLLVSFRVVNIHKEVFRAWWLYRRVERQRLTLYVAARLSLR